MADDKYSDIDERLESQLSKARQKAREGRTEKPLGRVGAKVAAKAGRTARKKAAEGGNGIFYILLMVAIGLDFMEWLDMGSLSTLVNIGAYMTCGGGRLCPVVCQSGSDNKLGLFNLLKGQLWKYLVLPLLEWVPIINILPFWTGTVVMMWWQFSREKKKILAQQEGEEPIMYEEEEYA